MSGRRWLEAISNTEWRLLTTDPRAGTLANPTVSAQLTVDGATVYVDASQSFSTNGAIVGTLIDFNDGAPAAAPAASHTYGVSGTVRVDVSVTDSVGRSSTSSYTAVVSAPVAGANRYPTAKLLASVAPGRVVTLDASGSSDPDGRVVSYRFSFGDGTTATSTSSPKTTHTYAKDGTFTPTVLVTDNGGLTASASATATVVNTRDGFTQPFASSSAWNKAIGSRALYGAKGTAAYNDLVSPGSTINYNKWTASIVQAKSGDPIVTLTSTQDSGDSYKVVSPLRIPAAPVIEATLADPTKQGSDLWTGVLQPDGHTLQEISGKTGQDDANDWHSKHAAITDIRGDGRSGVRGGSGTSMIAGVIREFDFTSGAIRHAVAMQLPGSSLGTPGGAKADQFTWPATTVDSSWNQATVNGSANVNYFTGHIKVGSLFAIPPVGAAGGGTDITAILDPATGKPITGDTLMLARALQDYGAYSVATSSNCNLIVEFSADDTRSKNLIAAWKLLRPYLRQVINNTSTTVGGGGTPRQPDLPALN